jgi:predicted PurR-regulated permease PerM
MDDRSRADAFAARTEETPMTDTSSKGGTTGSSSPELNDGSVERVVFRVPGWVRRAGTTSWMLIGVLIALAVLIGLIAATRDITAPLAIGVFLAVVFLPIVNWLDEHGVKRALGAGIVLVGLVVVIGGAGLITAEALGSQSDVLTENLESAVDKVKTWVEDLPGGAAAVDEVDDTARDTAPVARDGIATAVATAVDTAAGLIAGLILGTMVLFYLLKDGPMLTRRWVDAKADRADRDATERVVNSALRDIQGYFAGKTALAFVNGASIAIAMYVIGVPGAMAIGVVNFVGGYIPYIGAFIGGAFAVLMALGEGGIGLALAAFALVMVAQLLLENLLEPKLLGSSLNLHPLTILLATTLGGMVAGMIGLILAAPVVAIGLDFKRELTAVGFFDDD